MDFNFRRNNIWLQNNLSLISFIDFSILIKGLLILKFVNHVAAAWISFFEMAIKLLTLLKPPKSLLFLNSLKKYLFSKIVIEEMKMNCLFDSINNLKNGINKENGGLVITISDFFKISIHSKFLWSPLPFNLFLEIPSVVFSY